MFNLYLNKNLKILVTILSKWNFKFTAIIYGFVSFFAILTFVHGYSIYMSNILFDKKNT